MTQRDKDPSAKITKYEFTDKTVRPHRQHPFLRYITLVWRDEGECELIIKPRFDPEYAEARHLNRMPYSEFIGKFCTAAMMGPVDLGVSVTTHLDSHNAEGEKNDNEVSYKFKNNRLTATALLQSLLMRLQSAGILTEKQSLDVCGRFDINPESYQRFFLRFGDTRELVERLRPRHERPDTPRSR